VPRDRGRGVSESIASHGCLHRFANFVFLGFSALRFMVAVTIAFRNIVFGFCLNISSSFGFRARAAGAGKSDRESELFSTNRPFHFSA
jgi:hypothetical protein